MFPLVLVLGLVVVTCKKGIKVLVWSQVINVAKRIPFVDLLVDHSKGDGCYHNYEHVKMQHICGSRLVHAVEVLIEQEWHLVWFVLLLCE